MCLFVLVVADAERKYTHVGKTERMCIKNMGRKKKMKGPKRPKVLNQTEEVSHKNISAKRLKEPDSRGVPLLASSMLTLS